MGRALQRHQSIRGGILGRGFSRAAAEELLLFSVAGQVGRGSSGQGDAFQKLRINTSLAVSLAFVLGS